jgi:hypothetical protein
MDKKTAGLLGVVAGLATMGAAHAANVPAQSPLHAASYADLLAPVENAAALMKADDAVRARQPQQDPDIQLAQYYDERPGRERYYHHHHHHHHHHHREAYRHHHHHHHHQSTFVGIPGVGGVEVR